ncbi:UbiA family prenyltransferase [Vallitalea pronyensis]|uniref:4-hydroxybenzoate polyprenyltransferase n=1 Tax=Vallitalea pronyensis TaxID=1348613 RepID=A0A8J8MHU5_9FIRM|nr:UbiA-like polyprenyltransferase [Vallitalea pronyensis]QUI21721.1 UbiA family prenyltransferase [Vallitalea pronyensis]
MRLLRRLKTYGELVMFSHTLFSLPFALIAMIWAADGLPEGRLILWILIALVAGRNGANALNRWVDKSYDKMNPRTAHRHMPQNKVKNIEVLGLTAVCYGVFVLAAYQINTICFILSPIALALFTLYSYTKRFTWACHLVLGFTCAGAPVGAWLAVTGRLDIVPLVLGAVVLLWVAGFDIIYGTQDIDFDRDHGLFSIPAQFGFKNALFIARGFHLLMLGLLLGLYFYRSMSVLYLFGLGISAVLLTIEHYMVDPANRSKMNTASYHLNQIVSMSILVFTLLDFLWTNGFK